MELQFIITEKRGNVTLDICTQNGIPQQYTSQEFQEIIKILNNACEEIKAIKTKKNSESAPKLN